MKTVRLPLTMPADGAENFTVKLLLWPAERVIGVASPLTLKPVPVTTACVTLTSVVPTFVTLTICELGVPIFALTETLFGVTEREGNGSAKPAQPEVQRIVANKAT